MTPIVARDAALAAFAILLYLWMHVISRRLAYCPRCRLSQS